MQVIKLPVSDTLGHILVHNQASSDGRRVLRKGTIITEETQATLRSLNIAEVYVAVLTDNDINEDEAARRLGDLMQGHGLTISNATTGRVNLSADRAGLVKVNTQALNAFNDRLGITLATVWHNTPVLPQKVVATIKIIPYSIPHIDLQTVEGIIHAFGPLVAIKPFTVQKAVLITTGSETARAKVAGSFSRSLRERLSNFGTELVEGPYVAEDETAISQAITTALDEAAQLILIAGETSIMDINDITPRAIKAVGGRIVHYGVPVEPGNLLLLAYQQDIAIVGAPGCARSPSYNVIDMVLPRLAAGEKLTRRDLVKLGHGGYLK